MKFKDKGKIITMSEPIRVLQVFASMNRGGAETMIMNIYRNIDRSKVQFDFIVHTDDKCTYDDEIVSLGGNIYHVPKYRAMNHIAYIRHWKNIFRNHNTAMIIHGHIRSTASIYLKIAKEKGLSTIVHSHSTSSRGEFFSRIFKALLQINICNSADYLMACSINAAKWLFGNNIMQKPLELLNNSIESDKFIFNKSMRSELKKQCNLKDKFVIGHVGSFTSPKNHNYIVEIFSEIYSLNNKAVLLLIGDGDLLSVIKNKVNKLGLESSVIFLGVQSNVNTWLNLMDVFLMPSLFEGLPVSLIEAQANGLRCIVSDTISNEVNITNLVEFIPLSKPANYWAEQVLKYADGYERKDTYAAIYAAGYDIRDNAKWLENFYLNIHFNRKE